MARIPSAARETSLVSSEVFVAEHYLAGADPPQAETLTRLLGASGGHLRHALFVPADETYFAVYDSPWPDAVRTASAIAGRSRDPLDRVVRAVLLDPVPASESRGAAGNEWRNCTMTAEARAASVRAMSPTLRCACGQSLTGETGEHLLSAVEAHLERDHAELLDRSSDMPMPEPHDDLASWKPSTGSES